MTAVGHPLTTLEQEAKKTAKLWPLLQTCPKMDRCTYCEGIAVFHFTRWVHTCGKPACMSRAQEHIRQLFEEQGRRRDLFRLKEARL